MTDEETEKRNKCPETQTTGVEILKHFRDMWTSISTIQDRVSKVEEKQASFQSSIDDNTNTMKAFIEKTDTEFYKPKAVWAKRWNTVRNWCVVVVCVGLAGLLIFSDKSQLWDLLMVVVKKL